MIMTTLRKPIVILTVITALFAAASCGSKYNNTKFKDPNEGNPHVYGVDSSATDASAAPAEATK